MLKAVRVSPRKLLNFNKKNRLASKQDFRSVFASACKLSRVGLRVIYLPNQLGSARLGIIINKQQVRLAVQRNRLRRGARESFRHHLAALEGLDIVLMMRAECVALDTKVLRERIDNLWQKIS